MSIDEIFVEDGEVEDYILQDLFKIFKPHLKLVDFIHILKILYIKLVLNNFFYLCKCIIKHEINIISKRPVFYSNFE